MPDVLAVTHTSTTRGPGFPVYTAPVLSLVFVAWAVATRRLADDPRRVSLVAAIVLASGFWTLLRTDGMTGNSRHDLTWRWAETAEARLLVVDHVVIVAAIGTLAAYDAETGAPRWAAPDGGDSTAIRIS